MMFVMATALTFDVDVDDSRSAWTIQDSCRLLVDQYEALLREREVQLPAIRVVVTSEFDSTVDFEATKLDAPLAESSLSMGGIGSPHGKTIRNPGWTAATVVAKVPNQRLDVGQRMGLEKVISHELAHVAYGAVERDAIGVREEFPFTYPLAALLAVQGAEEYRVERIGQKVLELQNWYTGPDGSAAVFADLDRDGLRAALPAELDACAAALGHLSSQCHAENRIGEEDWLSVFSELQTLLMSVAYTEASSEGYPSVVSSLSSSASDLLRPLCDLLIDHVKISHLLPERSNWADDAAELGEIGVMGCVDVLDRLGIEIDLKTLTGSLSIATWSPD